MCAAVVSVRSHCAPGRALSLELERLPTPQAPPELVERARARVRAELAAAAERRWDNAVLACLTLFAWTVALTAWAIARLLSGGFLIALDSRFMQTLIWLTGSTVLVWLTAGVAAVLLGHSRWVTRRYL